MLFVAATAIVRCALRGRPALCQQIARRAWLAAFQTLASVSKTESELCLLVLLLMSLLRPLLGLFVVTY